MSKSSSVRLQSEKDSVDGPTGFIRQKTLLKDHAPFSASTLWRLVRAGRFPKPLKLASNVTAWAASDVREWERNPEAFGVKQIKGRTR
jgi:prophage regulatory protein